LTYILDMIYPVIICGAVFIVAGEVMLRKYWYFELLRNNYMICWRKSYTQIWQPGYWLRPSYGIFPHTIVFWTVLLAVSTRASQASLQIVVLQVFTLFFNFGSLIDLSMQSPPFAVIYGFVRQKVLEDHEAVAPDGCMNYALQKTCDNISKLTMVSEETISNEVSHLLNTENKDDMPMFGAQGTAPIGLRCYPLVESNQTNKNYLANLVLNLMTGFMWRQLWGTKLYVLCLSGMLASDDEKRVRHSKQFDSRHNWASRMFSLLAFIAMMSVLVLEAYGLVVGSKTAQQQSGQICSLADAGKDLASQCSAAACLRATCSKC